MKTKIEKPVVDASTEEKIKNAARLVFHRKGFSGTRTRDIAEEAGINLALLNYYFRSKEKLFDIIMLETLQRFMLSAMAVFNDEETSLDVKIKAIVSHYVDLLTAEPDIPLFIMSEIRRDPKQLLSRMGGKNAFMKSIFIKQFQQAVKAGKITSINNPLHFIMNLLGLTIFPFIASPMIRGLGDLSQKHFDEMMQERKILIPDWINMVLGIV